MKEDIKEDIKKEMKAYLWRHNVPQMWYGASTERWDSIMKGFFDFYFQPERLNPETSKEDTIV